MKKSLFLTTSFAILPVPLMTSCASVLAEEFIYDNYGAFTLLDKNYDQVTEILQSLLPSQISTKLLPVFPSNQLFGFQPNIQKITSNDANGFLKIEYKITKGNYQNTGFTFFTKFKTTQQAKIDQQIQPEVYFNVQEPGLLFKELEIKDNEKDRSPEEIVKLLNSVPENQKIAELAKYVQIDPQTSNDQTSLLKQKLPENLALKIVEAKTQTNRALADSLLVKVQIVKANQGSTPLILKIGGFIKKNSQGLKDQLNQTFLQNYVDNIFTTIDSPIKLPEKQAYLDILPSEIKTTEELLQANVLKGQNGLLEINNFLGFQDVRLKVTLKGLVPNTQLNFKGSLNAKFDFQLEGLNLANGQQPFLKDQEIHLYGFKIGPGIEK